MANDSKDHKTVVSKLLYNSHKTYFSYAPLDHAVAGITAGGISCILIQPFDVIKTQLQVSPQYKTSFSALKAIKKKGGYIKGLYSGLSPNLLGNISSWGLYFWGFNHIKQYIRQKKNADELTAAELMFAGTFTSLCVLSVTNPIWVIKTRMFLAAGNTRPMSTTNNFKRPIYKSISHAFTSIYKNEGLSGLYAGYSMGLVSCIHGGIQFSVYEKLVNWRLKLKKSNNGANANRPIRFSIKGDANKLHLLEYLSIVIGSKAIAQSITYPLTLIRSRLQDVATNYQKPYKNLSHCIIKTYQENGLRTFYRGFPLYLLRVSPHTCILFTTYEYIRSLLNHAAT